MYKISISNKGIETVIHYPSADTSMPKILNQRLNKKRGQAGSLSFSILPNNVGYNILTRMATLVTVTDIRDNKEIFSGRIYSVKSSMDSGGLFKKEIVCEGEMNYLHDTVVHSTIYEDKTPLDMITTFLNAHNSSVEEYKKIYVGNINVDDWLFFTANLETTLDAIIKYVYNEELGYLQLRKVNGIKYLDYIKTTTDKIVNIELTKNMMDLIENDDKDFGTRIVPVGANNLTIENVNGGLNYLEDARAVSEFGIIYKTVEFKDIETDIELKSQCLSQLSSYTTVKKSLEVGALDLATLANTSIDMLDENTSVHMINSVMNIDETWKVIEYDVDLTEVWQPKLTLSNKAITLSGTLNSLLGGMVRNDGDYNGIQIGDSFGLRIKNDLVKILLNAKEGISIENGVKKVFYLDLNGKLIAVDITAENMTANRGTFNDILTNNMIATLMKTSNTSNYMILYDQYIEFYHQSQLRMTVGFDGVNNLPSIKLYGENGVDVSGTISAGSHMASLGGNWTIENDSSLNVYGATNLAAKQELNELWINCINTFVIK
ncbi:phage tail protein [Clostridium tagluense]|uniref:phage tail protein n=1 Tax=Clostridium tagluense TaxID=360422 RepID=UPI001CF57F98|nr:phage tail protein [Clostridium tagluense]MCB2311601.1 phage tail protein [Clostridium tagluense]MCB2316325.1 phage tail protein [Clostridium tagluense]MCB2321291.1 phage tail protein [Clostridium tagluense]MCB2326194.1 phage tail protein [Clostridium tagluense]MCB2331027.1 phage tail protein [Clostridium tagluense]